MISVYVHIAITVVLLGCDTPVSVMCEEETVNHGPHVVHEGENGEHNAAYDHQAVLGSEDLEEEFAGLHPEEARARLQKMAEQHDSDKDGVISKDEMYQWITASFISLDREEGMEKFRDEDENGDGVVTWEEYINKVFGFPLEEVDDMRQTLAKSGGNEDEVKEIRSTLKIVDEDRRFFDGADLDTNGQLNHDEYMAFFFPHNYEHMYKLELERYLEQNDANSDGKISLKEFTPEDASPEGRITSEENFADLDKDKDGVLTPAELKEWVVPGTDELAEDEASHLFGLADINSDGKLTIDEILDKTEQFVGSSATDYGNLLRHEEL